MRKRAVLFFGEVFTARLVAQRGARYRLFFRVRRSVAGVQDAHALAAMDASTCRGGARLRAPMRVDEKGFF
jgi:hypothetical protein